MQMFKKKSMTDGVFIWSKDGQNAEKMKRKCECLSHTVGGRASLLVFCVPADNYLVSTESSIHCAGSLNWLTRNELMAIYSDKRPEGTLLC